MNFQALDAGSTQVQIGESGWKETQKDLDNSYMNCMGWTQMICSLKVYVEHGINLREGFF